MDELFTTEIAKCANKINIVNVDFTQTLIYLFFLFVFCCFNETFLKAYIQVHLNKLESLKKKELYGFIDSWIVLLQSLTIIYKLYYNFFIFCNINLLPGYNVYLYFISRVADKQTNPHSHTKACSNLNSEMSSDPVSWTELNKNKHTFYHYTPHLLRL